MKNNYPLIISLLSTGLLAGAFFYGTGNVIPAMYEVPIKVHLMYRVPLMDHNAVYMQLLTAIAIISTVWLAVTTRTKGKIAMLAAGGSLAALLSIVITRFGTVPINHMMRIWNKAEAPVNWMTILHTWDIYNYVRTCFAIISFISIVIIVQLKEH